MKVKIVRKKKSREVLRCINVNLNTIITKTRTFYVCSCSKSSHCCAK